MAAQIMVRINNDETLVKPVSINVYPVGDLSLNLSHFLMKGGSFEFTASADTEGSP
jgi:hypothetical protein